MTTETKTVARFDLWGFDGFMEPQLEGEFIRFVDHEAAVDEWKRLAEEARRNAINAESALAASRAEVEGLRKDAERWNWIMTDYFGGQVARANKVIGTCFSRGAMESAIDADLEKRANDAAMERQA